MVAQNGVAECKVLGRFVLTNSHCAVTSLAAASRADKTRAPFLSAPLPSLSRLCVRQRVRVLAVPPLVVRQYDGRLAGRDDAGHQDADDAFRG